MKLNQFCFLFMYRYVKEWLFCQALKSPNSRQDKFCIFFLRTNLSVIIVESININMYFIENCVCVHPILIFHKLDLNKNMYILCKE